MNVVVGTAGHIDHGKTSLLRALTGIDADRLPEERARGMTIDVGYAHLFFDDDTVVDFVDVPGHVRLVGNMLVGAGEIDAAMLVVAADDGPRAQTREHLDLLDALGLRHGIAVVTKIDLVDGARVREVAGTVDDLLAGTSLAGATVVAVSSATGEGLDGVRAALLSLVPTIAAEEGATRHPARLAIDRAFAVRGRGTVVTGSLRGAAIERGDELRLLPEDRTVRVRDIQVRGVRVSRAQPGRAALNVAGIDAADLRRGQVLVAGPGTTATDRLLVALTQSALIGAPPDPVAAPVRAVLHLGTDRVDAVVVRRGRLAGPLDERSEAAVLRLARPVAAAVGDRFVLRPPAPRRGIGGIVLDPLPPRGVSRRRATPERLRTLAAAVRSAAPGDRHAVLAALVELHGALPAVRIEEIVPGSDRTAGAFVAGPLALAPDVVATLAHRATGLPNEHRARNPLAAGLPIAELRAAVAHTLRRAAACDGRTADAAGRSFVDALVAAGRLFRHGDRVVPAGASLDVRGERRAAMDRLVDALDTPMPPALGAAARAAGCPPDAVRELEAAGEIVRIEDDLAFGRAAWDRIETTAVELSHAAPLTPAALRDALGSSRRYIMAALEELNRRGVLVRTAHGHVPGRRARDEIATR